MSVEKFERYEKRNVKFISPSCVGKPDKVPDKTEQFREREAYTWIFLDDEDVSERRQAKEMLQINLIKEK